MDEVLDFEDAGASKGWGSVCMENLHSNIKNVENCDAFFFRNDLALSTLYMFATVLLSSMNYCAVDPMDYIDYIYIEHTMCTQLHIIYCSYYIAYVSTYIYYTYFDKGW